MESRMQYIKNKIPTSMAMIGPMGAYKRNDEYPNTTNNCPAINNAMPFLILPQ